MPTTEKSVRRALLSVFDKSGIGEFATALTTRGIEIVSTGGTARALREAGIEVTDVSAVTGFPEIMDGRVKTLHPLIHGGLLGRRDDDSHVAAMADHGIAGIDLLAVNLYPFADTVARTDDDAEIIEMIDIGGPAMIRAAAKNHDFVTVLVDPSDYQAVIAAIDAGEVDGSLRRQLAGKAFAHTAEYDARVAAWFFDRSGTRFPETLTLTAKRHPDPLRYGENPHQDAAFYLSGDRTPGPAHATLIQGKPLSYNNINDTDAAYRAVAEFPPEEGAAVVIVKHANPCGVAVAPTLAEAYARALECDPVSAFGGIIGCNHPLDADTALAVTEIFTEVVIAPEIDEDAAAIFGDKPNLRLLSAGGLPDPGHHETDIRSVLGGYLVQDHDNRSVGPADLKVVTDRVPSDQEMADLLFAWRVAKHVKSNAIVFAKDRSTAGIGAGQMSRIDSTRIAVRKAGDAAASAGWQDPRTKGSVAASDAFFPFPDGVEAIADAGATAVIQPGGAMRDQDVIATANARGLAMVFTGVRHFRH